MKRIGILGGTFDPPHIGHLIMAEEVRVELMLDEVWFIPSYEPPHKKNASASTQDRLNMVGNSIDNNPRFKMNPIEIKREGKSYTYDTMKQLTATYPNTKFFFIIGADMVEYLPNWYKIDELLQLVTFVGVKRAGHRLKTAYPILQVDIPMIEISSTSIRNRVALKKSIKYLVPDSVYTYIKERGLYEH